MSLYLIQFDGLTYPVEAAGFSDAEHAWRCHLLAEDDGAEFDDEPDSITLLSREDVIRGATPCPTPSGADAITSVRPTTSTGTDATSPDANATASAPTPPPSDASADTGATSAGSMAGGSKTESTNPTTTARASTTTPGIDSAPPLTEEPDPMKWVRMTRAAVEKTRSSNGLNPNWWCPAAVRLCDAHEALMDAYDSERAHHARTTQTLCTERAALTIERARVAKIAAILSDDTLEHPQKIGRALRVAEGAS